MAICACRTSSAGAPALWGAEAEVPERVRLHFHAAELDRSFAKIGIMDPYIVASVDGRVVYRSGAAAWSHKSPTWDASYAVHAKELPRSVTVAVWNQNRLRRDVLCGSVTVPLTDDMGVLQEKEFALTKHSRQTGKIRLSLAMPCNMSAVGLMSSGSTLGAELDHIVQWIEGSGNSAGLDRGRSLELAEIKEEVAGEDSASHPTLLSGTLAMKAPLEAGFRNQPSVKHAPVRPDEPAFTPQQSMLSGSQSGLPDGAVAPVASSDAQAEAKPEAGEDEPQGLPEPLAGHWDCTDTFGLEEFLTKAGLGSFQRRLAMAARWPSWDFKILPDRVKFTNHSALGDLNEDILLDGTSYTWRDGKMNLLNCTAKWTKSADGGCLRIWRSHAKASFHEDRVVSGDTLTFTLYGDNGESWGRTFQRGK